MYRILFVCLGNICRSPLAEGVFRARALERGLRIGPGGVLDCDSAGTSSYHIGEPPDPRAIGTAARVGIDISGQRARQITRADFEAFDLLLAMDRSNLAAMTARCPDRRRDRLALFLSFAAPGAPSDLPDPYYGGADGFDLCLSLAVDAASGLLDDLSARNILVAAR